MFTLCRHLYNQAINGGPQRLCQCRPADHHTMCQKVLISSHDLLSDDFSMCQIHHDLEETVETCEINTTQKLPAEAAWGEVAAAEFIEKILE